MGHLNVSTIATFDWKKLLPLCYNDFGLVFQSILRLTKLLARNLLLGHVVQSVARLTHELEVPGLIPGPATNFSFSFR